MLDELQEEGGSPDSTTTDQSKDGLILKLAYRVVWPNKVIKVALLPDRKSVGQCFNPSLPPGIM
jgi:hypothetical protein